MFRLGELSEELFQVAVQNTIFLMEKLHGITATSQKQVIYFARDNDLYYDPQANIIGSPYWIYTSQTAPLPGDEENVVVAAEPTEEA